MKDRSAKPLRTASKVPGGADTARGRMLHLILPLVFFSSSPHHSFCVSDRVCVGDNQLDAASTVCAWADPKVASEARAKPKVRWIGATCMKAPTKGD